MQAPLRVTQYETMRRFLLTAFALAALPACLPVPADDRPLVVFLNGPSADYVEIAAVTVQRAAEDRSDVPFRVVGNTTARFLETRRSISGRRAPQAAAGVADGLGAERAVLIGVPLRERELELFEERRVRSVAVTVQLQAQIIDAESGEVLETIFSRSLSGGRDEPLDTELVALDDDPTVRALVERGAAEIAPAVIAALGRTLALP